MIYKFGIHSTAIISAQQCSAHYIALCVRVCLQYCVDYNSFMCAYFWRRCSPNRSQVFSVLERVSALT